MPISQRIAPCLWFDHQAEEAATFYGLSWQIVPTVLPEMPKDHESPKAQRAMEAMLRMKKIDIGELERAVAG